MSDAFDPYYIWLGIPPEDQPPHHYRLLGVTLFESNREVIEAAATSYAYFSPFWFDVANLNGVETFGASVGMRALELLNLRAIYLEELEASRNDAFDYYVFIRNAYLQSRRAKCARKILRRRQ